MRDGLPEAVGDSGDHDFLFTWKPEHWSPRKLLKLVKAFKSVGTAEVWWRCRSYRKIQPGDRAYLLKQGKPIGIFARGSVIQKDKKSIRDKSGLVLIRFEALRGDVFCNPTEEFLVDEKHLPTPKSQWQIRASGMPLESRSARQIDNIIGSILDPVLIAPGQAALTDEVARDVARRKKLIEHSLRPEQQRFSGLIRKNYRYECAVTGCVTHAALEAAHISTREGADNDRSDDNRSANGILLRRDIHGLFDDFLITLSEDGTGVELSPELTDPGYTFLKTVTVTRPDMGAPPSAENIRRHRKLFLAKRGGTSESR